MFGRVVFFVLYAVCLSADGEAGLIEDLAGLAGGTVDHIRGHVHNAVKGVESLLQPQKNYQGDDWQNYNGAPRPEHQGYHHRPHGHHHGHQENCHSNERPAYGQGHYGHGYPNNGQQYPSYGRPEYPGVRPGNNGFGVNQRPYPGQNNYGERPYYPNNYGQGNPGGVPYYPGQGNFPAGQPYPPNSERMPGAGGVGQKMPGYAQNIPTVMPGASIAPADPKESEPKPPPVATVPGQKKPPATPVVPAKVETTTEEEFQLDIRGDFKEDESQVSVQNRFFIDAPTNLCTGNMRMVRGKCRNPY